MDWSIFATWLELARGRGPDKRVTCLCLCYDRSIRLRTIEVGPASEGASSGPASERTLDVSREAMTELVVSLLRERYQGRSDAVEDLRELCRRHGVAHSLF
jgi:hypothetical protein